MLARLAREPGIGQPAVNTRRGQHSRGARQIQNVNAHHSRFRQWMGRFNDVATAGLPASLAALGGGS